MPSSLTQKTTGYTGSFLAPRLDSSHPASRGIGAPDPAWGRDWSSDPLYHVATGVYYHLLTRRALCSFSRLLCQHRIRGLRPRKCVLSQLWGDRSDIKVAAGLRSLQGCRRGSFLPLAAPGPPLHPLPPPSPGLLRCVPLFPVSALTSLLEGHLSLDLGPTR